MLMSSKERNRKFFELLRGFRNRASGTGGKGENNMEDDAVFSTVLGLVLGYVVLCWIVLVVDIVRDEIRKFLRGR